MAVPNIKLPFHSVFIVLVVGLVFWVIGLAGFGAVTDKCRDALSTDDCAHTKALEWFAIVLELFAIGLLVAFALVKLLGKLKLALLAYFTIATVLFINHAHFYVNQAYFSKSALKLADAYDAARTAAAGSVLLALYNFVVIGYVSWLETSTSDTTIPTRQVDVEAPEPAKAVEEKPAAVSAEAAA